jgi:hypothetical protein
MNIFVVTWREFIISYDTHLSLIIFKIILHPMTLLTAIPLQVIILHFM